MATTTENAASDIHVARQARAVGIRATIEEMAALYGEAWNSQDLEAILARHAEDGVFQLHAGAEPVEGIEAVRATFAGILAQFPDINFEQQRLIADERGWLFASTMSGTLAQPLELAGAVIAEPGAKFAVDALDVIDVRDGLITAKHTYVDAVAMLQQLGWKP